MLGLARACGIPLVVASALVLGCSSSESAPTTSRGAGARGGACADYTPPKDADLTTPVSFALHVIPMLQKHCSYGECHGEKEFPVLGYYGGEPDGGEGTDPAVIKKNIVNVPSKIHASMLLIKPGDPDNSFFLRKMDGDHCLLADQCKKLVGCGEQMPNDRPVLSPEERLYVRRWIAQGAK